MVYAEVYISLDICDILSGCINRGCGLGIYTLLLILGILYYQIENVYNVM